MARPPAAFPNGRRKSDLVPIMKQVTSMVLGLWALAASPGLAWAEEESLLVAEGEVSVSYAVADETELDGSRGSEGVSVVNGSGVANATMTNNTAVSNNVSSYNVIEKGAFTDAAGVVSVMQNTGNNVILQNVTVINVHVQP